MRDLLNKIAKLEKLLNDSALSKQAMKGKIRELEKKIKDLEYVVSNFNHLEGEPVRREKRADKDHL
jgi:archaellum component FlaC